MGTAELCAEMQFNVSACECVQYPRGGQKGTSVPGRAVPRTGVRGRGEPLVEAGNPLDPLQGELVR